MAGSHRLKASQACKMMHGPPATSYALPKTVERWDMKNDTFWRDTQKFKGARPQNIRKGCCVRALALANCARDATQQQQGFGSHEAFPALAAKTLGAFPKHMLAFWPIPKRRAFTSFCFRMFWEGLSSQTFTKEGVTLHGERGPCYSKKWDGGSYCWSLWVSLIAIHG